MRITFTWLLVAVLLGGGLVVAQVRAQAAAPVINSISPTIGPIGQLVLLEGSGFTDSNEISFGFGKKTGVVPTGPTSSTLGTLIHCSNPDASPDDDCNTWPVQGYVDVTVTNANGTSNAVKFLVAPHGGGCYEVDDFDSPSSIAPVDCDDARCNAGACEVVATPTPTPTPTATPTATPTPTPTPVPTPNPNDDEVEQSSSGSSSGGSSSSSSSSSGSVAAAKTTTSTVRRLKGPSAADKAAADYILNNQVVATVESFYRSVYGKATNFCTSHYWKTRARHDKATRSKLLGAMRWQKAKGKDPIYLSCHQGRVSGAKTSAGSSSGSSKITHRDINRLFRQINGGQNPTATVNKYWISRLADKKTAASMLGAMQWHRTNNTGY